jgi:Ser/Thr protein kinase RdoA (MazF antagonist)
MTIEQQVDSLSDCLVEILTQYGLDRCQTESINHEFNSTFKIHSNTGEKFALRINVNSNRSRANLNAEVVWVSSITEVKVPKPIATRVGGYVSTGWHEATQRKLSAVLYTWLEGQEPGDEPTFEQLEAAGKAMALLHRSSSKLQLASDAEFPVLTDFYWGAPDLLSASASGLSDSQRDAIDTVKTEVSRGLTALASTNSLQPIHADLHPWNLMWHQGELAVFDFDDSGLGLPVQDLATSLYYLDTEEQDRAFLAGYASVQPVPEYSPEFMQLLFLQRRLMLLNYLHETSNPEHKAMLADYQAETMQRLENRTGRPVN